MSEEYYRLRDKGKEHLQLDNSQKAIEYYTRAINEASKLVSTGKYQAQFIPQEKRAECIQKADHNNRTCQSCSSFLEVPICYANRSLAYFNLKKYDSALVDSERAIALAPEWPKVRGSLVCCIYCFEGILSEG